MDLQEQIVNPLGCRSATHDGWRVLSVSHTCLDYSIKLRQAAGHKAKDKRVLADIQTQSGRTAPHNSKQEIERLLKCVLLECGCLGGVKCGGEG